MSDVADRNPYTVVLRSRPGLRPEVLVLPLWNTSVEQLKAEVTKALDGEIVAVFDGHPMRLA